MITLVEALNFRCLRHIRQPLGEFHVLVGPNASGKTTFLDVIGFLADFVNDGLDSAIERRARDLRDLFWARSGDRFELAVEVRIPADCHNKLPQAGLKYFRYEVVVGIDAETGENSIISEVGRLKEAGPRVPSQRNLLLFPSSEPVPKTIQEPTKRKRSRTVFSKQPGQSDNYYPETRKESGTGGWVPAFKLGPKRSTLANLPEDETRFPVATWFKNALRTRVERLILNGGLMRLASPPGQGKLFKPDGSNLPWVIHELESKHPDRLKDWVEHVSTALPDLKKIDTVERQDDRHRYLRATYATGLQIPSWLTSDGTLRLLALTLPAYLPELSGVYLIEEPENGIHPRAVETMFQSLSSVYGAQILLATHSPVILSSVRAEQVLCFGKTADGATDIVRGDRHPRLREWRGEENLGVLFAAGVLS